MVVEEDKIETLKIKPAIYKRTKHFNSRRKIRVECAKQKIAAAVTVLH